MNKEQLKTDLDLLNDKYFEKTKHHVINKDFAYLANDNAKRWAQHIKHQVPKGLPDEKFKIDRYVKYDKKTDKMIVRNQKPDKSLNFTPLIPGDVIYYPCAFSLTFAEHFAIYIGDGWVIHHWCKDRCLFHDISKKDDPNGYVILTKLVYFHPPPDEKTNIYSIQTCGDKDIYVLDRTDAFLPRWQIIHNAADNIGIRNYKMTKEDCQTFALEMATNQCNKHMYLNKKRKSKRIRDYRYDNYSDEQSNDSLDIETDESFFDYLSD